MHMEETSSVFKGMLAPLHEVEPGVLFCFVKMHSVHGSQFLCQSYVIYEANVEGSELEIWEQQNNLTLKAYNLYEHFWKLGDYTQVPWPSAVRVKPYSGVCVFTSGCCR